VEVAFDLEWAVGRVGADGAAEIAQKVRRARVSSYREHPGGERVEVAYDSRDPDAINNPWSALMEEAFRPLIGEPFALKLDARGRVLSVSLPERAREAWGAMPWLKG